MASNQPKNVHDDNSDSSIPIRKRHFRPKREYSREERISRDLSYVLRHGAEKLRLPMRSSGYVELSVLLNTPKFKNKSVTQEEVLHVVATNKKQRFSVATDIQDDVIFIRANQGHSLSLVQDEDLLIQILDPSQVPICVHGTDLEVWPSILKIGLSKMTRNHIHFTPSDVLVNDTVISGFRQSCSLLIYINMQAALADGIQFFRSSNNVILSPGLGESGIIPPKYFLRAVKRNGTVIYEGDNEGELESDLKNTSLE